MRSGFITQSVRNYSERYKYEISATIPQGLNCYDPEVAGHLMQVSATLGPRLVRALSADGYNVWTANGAVAGQQVFHLHLHLLPRFETDEFGFRFPKNYPTQADRMALDQLAARIRATE